MGLSAQFCAVGRRISRLSPGEEVNVALASITRLAPQLPGALGLIYDGALRGIHLAELLHRHGLLPMAVEHASHEPSAPS